MLSTALRAPAFADFDASSLAASLEGGGVAAVATAAASHAAKQLINATVLDGSGRSLSEGGDSAAASEGPSTVWSAIDAMRSDFTNRQVPSNEPSMELGLVYQPFWAMFAEFDLDELAMVPFGLPLMWVYVVIANIVLVNMLIAMFADTYTRIKKNALLEYHFQHYMCAPLPTARGLVPARCPIRDMWHALPTPPFLVTRGGRYIFEYQYVVRTIPPPFNFPLLLWDTCAHMCRSREHQRNMARMHLDDGYDEDPSYGAPSGVDRDEGLSMMRKYVQRYLISHTEQVRDNSMSSLALRMERNVSDMEERMMHEFEHIHNSLIAPNTSGRTEQKLTQIAIAIDRMIKGERQAAAASLVSAKKNEMRGASPPVALAKAASKLVGGTSQRTSASAAAGGGGGGPAYARGTDSSVFRA